MTPGRLLAPSRPIAPAASLGYRRRRQRDVADAATYRTLVVNDQGATHYWPLQTGKVGGQTETDLGPGGLNLSMGGGDSTTGTGPGATDLTGSVVVASADTEGFYAAKNYDPDQDWSLSFWAKLTASGGFYCAWRMALATGTNYMLLIHRNDEGPAFVVQMSTGAGAYCRVNSGVNMVGAGWKHIAVTRDYDAVAANDRIKIYFNGVEVANQTRAAIGWTADLGADDWMIGAQSDAYNFGWDGDLCAAAFWHGTVLTGTQIADQYDRGLL